MSRPYAVAPPSADKDGKFKDYYRRWEPVKVDAWVTY
jgi:hypothetical protein